MTLRILHMKKDQIKEEKNDQIDKFESPGNSYQKKNENDIFVSPDENKEKNNEEPYVYMIH